MTVSVIVPVYNAGVHFTECMDSILGQTYKDLEIILVDDGSDDQSGKRCDDYAAADGRVIVIHKTNGGATSARIAGLKAASGALAGFVDADDWIEADYIEKMVHAQQASEADIVVSGHFHDIGGDSQKVYSSVAPGIYTRQQLLPHLLYGGRFFEYGLQPHMVTKLFRREIVCQVQMNVDERITIGEDAAVVYPAVLKALCINVTGICGYHYVQRQGSMTRTKTRNEMEIYVRLSAYLEQVFKDEGVWEIMAPQLAQYQKYLLFMRQMQIFDARILLPYGGIPKDSRVIIYGAGVLGQKMYQYLRETDGPDIVLWADKNYVSYRRLGMGVVSPEKILDNKNYDYILIANTVQQTADNIRDYLKGMGVVDEKILWFSKEFISSDKYLNLLCL